MKEKKIHELKKKVMILFPSVFLALVTLFVISAGSFNYWQAWVFCGVLFIPMLFVVAFFLRYSPEFLERRMRFREKEVHQKLIIRIAAIVFLIGIVFPGLDYRFEWSHVPVWLVFLSDILIMIGYFIVFLTFKENVYSARTIEVFKGQKVIDTGLYASIRHPMYLGMLIMYLFMPLALGSFWAIVFFLPIIPILILRLLNEELVLKRDLTGYRQYCNKVKYHLIPHIW